MSTKVETPMRLRLERTIRAPRERVWDAWTQPEQLQRWSAPEGLEIPEGDMDLRVGGRWRVVMQDPESGKRFIAVGTYREVTRPERLVYTHSWTTDEHPVDTLLTVEFHDEGESTRVVLTQEGFATVGSRDGHEQGWASTLDRLVRMMEQSA